MKEHVHIFGASGAGTTTVSKIVSEKLGYLHFDSDNYFWLPIEDPYTVKRGRGECLRLLNDDLTKHSKWILSGSLTNWGNEVIPYFDLVVFLYVPAEVRLQRLKQREYERYGEEIFPGGSRYKQSEVFLEWAASYDDGPRIGRSLATHEAWLKGIPCSTVRVMNDTLENSVGTIVQAIQDS